MLCRNGANGCAGSTTEAHNAACVRVRCSAGTYSGMLVDVHERLDMQGERKTCSAMLYYETTLGGLLQNV